MPRTTLGGDDPAHQLPDHKKDQLEKELRRRAREPLHKGDAKKRKELENRAVNISRKESKIQQHHS